jgi:DUF1680 family protein
LPFELRWKKEREEYISFSNCCPPNLVRTISETQNYAYAFTRKGIAVILYGSNRFHTELPGNDQLRIRQETNYPWDGTIKLILEEVPDDQFEISLRIPGWANEENTISVNHQKLKLNTDAGQFVKVSRKWKKGDVIELRLSMATRLMAANRLVEETRNQVAVKRGPIVYCLESPDLEGRDIFDVVIPVHMRFKLSEIEISGARMIALKGDALIDNKLKQSQELYLPLDSKSELREQEIQLIPYFAWGNRGESDMSVWIPVQK